MVFYLSNTVVLSVVLYYRLYLLRIRIIVGGSGGAMSAPMPSGRNGRRDRHGKDGGCGGGEARKGDGRKKIIAKKQSVKQVGQNT